MEILRRYFSLPTFADEESQVRARVMYIILVAMIIFGSVIVVVGLTLGGVQPSNLGMGVVSVFIIAGLLWLLCRGYLRAVVWVFSLVLLGTATLMVYNLGTIYTPNLAMYLIAITLAGLLLNTRVAVSFLILAAASVGALSWAEGQGMLPPPSRPAIGPYMVLIFVGIFVIIVQHLMQQGLTDALDRARRNEQALAAQAQEIAVFRALAENATDTILMGTPQGTITYANPAAYAAFGWNSETQELVGKDIPSLLPEAEDEGVRQANMSAIFQAESWRGELTHRRKDNTVFNAADTIFPVWDENDEQVALAAIIRDITEQRKAQLEREHLQAEREQLQQETLEAQKKVIQELSTPVIPIMDKIIVLPLVGTIDSMRARDITRSLLAGISRHKARVVILDVTGVSLMDTGIVNHLNKTIQAAQLKGAQTIITGISDVIAESIVDLGIDWSEITTLSDLQSGLRVALSQLGLTLNRA